MGLEILFGISLICGIAASVFFPVAFWAVWLSRGQARLVDGLGEQGIALLSAHNGDAGAPVQLVLDASGYAVKASATVRGTTPLWHVSVRRAKSDVPGVAFVHGAWAARSDYAREVRAKKKCGAYLLYHAEGALDVETARFVDAAERLLTYRDTITELALTADTLELEVQRGDLMPAELSRWIWVATGLLARMADEEAPHGVRRLPTRGHGASFGGSSVGVAGA